jgi:hypothetical protein
MHLCQIYANRESINPASHFVLLWIGAKFLKKRRYKLTVRTGIYFSAGFAGMVDPAGRKGRM